MRKFIMTMKKAKIVLMSLVALLFVGCYNDFDNPAPAKVWTDKDIEASGAVHWTIKQVKDHFIEQFGSLSNTGNNGSWNDTKYYKFDEEMENGGDIYIKGKVISNDREGNIFKSLFLWDGTAGIEVRLTNGNFLTYHMGEYNDLMQIPTQWVYIKLKGLYVGNYRMMLSIGNGPTDSYNSVGEHKFYANSNIEQGSQIREHVFPGERTTLRLNEDIKVVNESNYKELGEADFGRLVRFEGITCHYAGVEDQNGVETPFLKNGNYDQMYPSWIYTDVRPIVNKAWYRMAYSHKNTNLFGSVCFTYNHNAQYTSEKGVYMVRSSGYSRFSSKPVVKNGAKGNITGIYGIYSKRSDYTGGQYDFATYQLSLNRFADLEFDKSDFLTEEDVLRMTPEDSYKTPNIDDEQLD